MTNSKDIYKKIQQMRNLDFTPTDLIQSTVKPEEMNYWELNQFVNKLSKNGVKDPRWAVNMHFKIAFACTSILMVIFGIFFVSIFVLLFLLMF